MISSICKLKFERLKFQTELEAATAVLLRDSRADAAGVDMIRLHRLGTFQAIRRCQVAELNNRLNTATMRLIASREIDENPWMHHIIHVKHVAIVENEVRYCLEMCSNKLKREHKNDHARADEKHAYEDHDDEDYDYEDRYYEREQYQ